jgi:hypothetical protein
MMGILDNGAAACVRFRRKGEGRIFTDSEEHVTAIREIIRAMDADEYDYLPADLVAVYGGYDEVVYNGKFCDLDLDELQEHCRLAGIPCRVVVAEVCWDA